MAVREGAGRAAPAVPARADLVGRAAPAETLVGRGAVVEEQARLQAKEASQEQPAPGLPPVEAAHRD